MTTDLDIGNRALELTGTEVQISALNDGTPEGNAVGVLYVPTVQLVLREVDPAFARRTLALVPSGAATPIVPWSYEYLYPADCIRLRQVRPATSDDDPEPVRAAVGLDIIASVATKVILTNQAGALAVYTSSSATESQWDSAFSEAVVRKLASPLAMALAGRPDFAKELLEEADRFAQLSETIDEG